MTDPTISVIMATYKGAAIVGETIASVLAQTRQDFEIVIADDCSPDDTLAVLKAYRDPRIRVFSTPTNGGPVKTRNFAVAAARGRYIAALDQDDICHPQRFAKQIEFLDANPAVVLVASAADHLEGGRVRRGRWRGPTTPALVRWKLHFGNPLVWSSVMMRGDAARMLQPFSRHEILMAEDFDLYHRISAQGKIARIDEPLLQYRVHPGGVSKTHNQAMVNSALAVLTGVYRPIFGADAEAAARLIILHHGQGKPVEDRAALDRIGEIIIALRAYLAAEIESEGPETSALIDSAIAEMWWGLIRSAIRAGSLPPSIVAHQRPPAAEIDAMSWRDFTTASLIGAARRITARS